MSVSHLYALLGEVYSVPPPIFLKDVVYFFRERGREGEREEEKQCMVASHLAPTGDLACNPDWESNQQPFG